MNDLIFPLAVTAAIATGLTGHGGMVQARPNNHVSIKIAAEPAAAVSGYPISLTISLRNRSGLPLRFVNSGGPWRFFECERVEPGGRAVRIPRTRWGRMIMGTLMPMGGPIRPMHQVAVGKTKVWGDSFPLSRCYDLTLPGRYYLQMVTQRPICLVDGPIHAYVSKGGHLQAATFEGSLYLPSFEESMKALAATKFVPKGRAYSNPLKVRVRSPEGLGQPQSALVAARLVHLGGNTVTRTGTLLSLFRSPTHGRAFPVLAWVTICVGRKPGKIRLTGNPLIDFYNVQADGPDGRNGSELVKRPTPHYVPISNWKPTPLTAYGKWLAKHRLSRALKWKTYTVHPGVVYKYTVPVNLSCRFDMSLAGAYHVRLRLARTHIWSPWVTVTVPPN